MSRIDSAANDLSIVTPKANFSSFYKRDGMALFQDFCSIINGEQGSFAKFSGMPKIMALELTESIISSFPLIFLKNLDFLNLIKEKICPNLIRFFSDKTEVRIIHFCKSPTLNFTSFITFI